MTIFLRPLIKLKPSLSFWERQLVANQREGQWSRWKVKPFVEVGNEKGKVDGEKTNQEREDALEEDIHRRVLGCFGRSCGGRSRL